MAALAPHWPGTMLDKLRNIGIIAHVDAGKTTTTERILYFSGSKHKVGDVDEGNTTTDFDPLERAKGITINSAAVTVEWGDARITFVVAPGQRGHGVGAFILERLEDEAAARGLNYIYNVVPETHPDGPWIRNWLAGHGFHEASRGQLRRQVSVTSA